MADFLGVSLGRDEVAFAVVSRRRDQLNVTLTRRVEYEEPVPDVAARASLAAARAAETGLPRAAVAIALPGEEVFLQPHSVPFTRRSHIERTLAFEMEDKLPFEVDLAVLDFSVVSSEGPNSRILVAALQRSVLESVVAPFTAAGFKVRLVTSEVLAAGALAALAERNSYALLDVSPSGWHLAVCDSGRLVFARAAPAAPTDAALEASLAGWFRQSLSAAVTDLRPPAVILSGSRANDIDIEALADRIELPVELLALSDTREVEAVRDVSEEPTEGAPAESILEGEEPPLTLEGSAAVELAALEDVWGGEAPETTAEGTEVAAAPAEGVREGEVSEAAAEDTAAEIAPPESTYEVEIPPAIAEEATAPGEAVEGTYEGEPVEEPGGEVVAASGALLAAAALCKGTATMDLLRAARGRRRLSEVLFGPVASALILISLVCGVLSWGHLRQRGLHEADRGDVERAEMQVWRNVFPESDPPGGNINLGLKSAVRELEEARGGAATRNCAWFLRALYVLSASLPPDHSLTFEKFDATPDKLTINVSTGGSDPEEKHEVDRSINEEGTFSARITDVVAGSGGKTTYKIVIAPKGEGGE